MPELPKRLWPSPSAPIYTLLQELHAAPFQRLTKKSAVIFHAVGGLVPAAEQCDPFLS
jgi:hypothetical protein